MPPQHGTDKHRTAKEMRHPLSCSRRPKLRNICMTVRCRSLQMANDSGPSCKKRCQTVPPHQRPHQKNPGTFELLSRNPQSLLSGLLSRSPKAGHPKAGRSDFRNQRFETDTEKTRKMRKVPLTPEKQGSEEIPKSKNAENAENADTKTRKVRMTGFNVTGFR